MSEMFDVPIVLAFASNPKTRSTMQKTTLNRFDHNIVIFARKRYSHEFRMRTLENLKFMSEYMLTICD